MTAATATAAARAPLAALHATFAPVVPAVEVHAGRTFRGIRCPHDRADAVADALAAAWERFLRLVTERAPVDPADLARRAVAAVNRRLGRHPLLPA